jgi:hypothetical protein
MKNINPLGLFDDHFLLETLSKLGDPLQKLSEYIDWSIFEAPLDQVFSNETKDLLKGGRPPFSKLILFKALIIQSLYNLSDDQLEFQIVDRASFKRFVEVPRQRNTREENKHIKETGTAPQDWKVKPHKLAQKDVDARWTKKNNTVFYGYKNHVKADTKTKLIEEYTVTDASVHDS